MRSAMLLTASLLLTAPAFAGFHCEWLIKDKQDEIDGTGPWTPPGFTGPFSDQKWRLYLLQRDLMERDCEADKRQEILDKKPNLRIGMTAKQVRDSSNWGSPQKVNRTTTVGRVTEQWVYSDGFLYFTNGRLTAIQD